MTRRSLLRCLPVTLVVALTMLLSCRSTRETRPQPEPSPPDLRPAIIEYVDSDAFDALFESALTRQDAAIVIRTSHSKPDWKGRLNAWIAAWNMGGRPENGSARGQAPIPKVTIDGDSIREFRLLVDDLMGRVENLAKVGGAWFAEERTRSHRVALLRPYNLRFHVGSDGNIELIFFNGRYARYYQEFVQARSPSQEPEEWARCCACSMCKDCPQAHTVKAHVAILGPLE